MTSYIKGGILAGIVLFLWGVISWMALPWHMSNLHAFQDEKAVTDVVMTNSEKSGIYIIPFQMQSTSNQSGMPLIFASVYREGMSSSMMMPMAFALLGQIIAAILVGWLLTKTSGLSYFGRVCFVLVFALTAGIVTHAPNWIWFCFDATYTLIAMADLLIGWFFAGLILAKFCSR